MKRLLYGILTITGLAIAGCSGDCLDNKNALPYAGFYSSEDPTATVSVDSLRVYGIGAPGDSVLYDGSGSTSLYLPFRIDSDTTSYVFEPTNIEGVSDTVRFIYDRIPRLVSEECGVSYIFRIRNIYCSRQLIDSVTCPNGEITNANSENLRIYFRVS
jgi:hypothetical protein